MDISCGHNRVVIKRYGNKYKLRTSIMKLVRWCDNVNAIDKYTGTIDITKLIKK